MDFPEQEVNDLSDDFITKELIFAYKEHIKTLQAEIARLKSKYEPEGVQSSASNVAIFPPRKPRIGTTTQLIKELEKRTGINPGKVEENV